MRKRMNRKGAFTWNQFLGLVLGVIVLGLVAFFAMGGFGKFGDLLGKFSSVEITAQACGGYASAGLVTSYCSVFQKVEISGVKQYVTCEYLEGAHTEIVFDKMGEGDCTSNQDNLAKAHCKTLKNSAIVNGKVCYATTGDNWGFSKNHLICKAKAVADKAICEAIKVRATCEAHSKCEW